MKLGSAIKQPAERRSYTINYEEALTAGDNVATASATVSPAGLTLEDVGVYDPRVKFWVSGGTAGTKYKVTVTVNTEDGQIFQDEVFINVKEI